MATLRIARTDEGVHPHVFLVGPHTGQAGNALSRNVEIGTGPNQRFFQAADILDCTEGLALAVSRAKSAEIKDRVADKLSRAVECHVTAAIAFKRLHAAAR